MADKAADVGEIIKAARKRPQNCAMLVGKDGPVIEAHPTKSLDAMVRAAKQRDGGPKGDQGTLTVEGKTLILTCVTEDVPASLPRQVKRYLSDQGFPFKVIFALPTGEQMDDGEKQGPAGEAVDLAGLPGSPPAPPLRRGPEPEPGLPPGLFAAAQTPPLDPAF